MSGGITSIHSLFFITHVFVLKRSYGLDLLKSCGKKIQRTNYIFRFSRN